MTIGVSSLLSTSRYIPISNETGNTGEHQSDSEDRKPGLSISHPSHSGHSEDNDKSIKAPKEIEAMDSLNREEQQIVNQLKARDRQVRSHEQQHLAAAGSLAQGGASFTYKTGPDGNQYAVGGEVSVDTNPVPGDPQATIQKAEQLRRAALAPAMPSAADRQIAAKASAMAQEARAELLRNGSNNDASPAHNQNAEAEAKTETACEICGAAHSVDSHVEGVRHQIETTFLDFRDYDNDRNASEQGLNYSV